MEQLKYTDLLDYILVLLRIVRKGGQPSHFLSLKALTKLLNYPSPFSDVQEIGRYLEARGWTKVIYPLGDVRAQITTTGLVYLEEKGKQLEDDFNKYWGELKKEKSPKDLVISVYEEKEDPLKDISDILDNVITKLKTTEYGKDFQSDVEIIKLELSKVKPDLQLIEIKLNNLGGLSAISSEIQDLKDYLIVK